MRIRKLDFVLVLLLGILSLPASVQRSYDIDILADTFGYCGGVTRSVDLRDLEQGRALQRRVNLLIRKSK